MTATTKIMRPGSVIIWPENTDEANFGMEHALAVVPYSDGVSIEQNGQHITVPRYALRALIKTLRDMEKEA